MQRVNFGEAAQHLKFLADLFRLRIRNLIQHYLGMVSHNNIPDLIFLQSKVLLQINGKFLQLGPIN
jgi:hypothetical protein